MTVAMGAGDPLGRHHPIRGTLGCAAKCGASQTRYVIETTGIALASAKKGAAAQKIPSLRFLQVRR